MFGTFRLLLAFLVVYTHLGTPHGAALGKHAVFGFYALSGFLITRVLNDLYRFDFVPFALNRALRLYPMYLAVAALTVPALFVFDAPGSFNGRYNLPDGWWAWAKCLLILPTHDLPPFRLVPVSWSVAVEIINYLILWAFTARGPRFAWIALSVGVAVHAATFAMGLGHNARYLPWSSASLAFSIGALVYFHRDYLARVVPSSWIVMGCWAGILVWSYLLGGMSSVPAEIAFYVGLLSMGAVITVLERTEGGRLDRFLGDLAYPAFLAHILVGLVLNKALGIAGRSDLLFIASVVPILMLSAALVFAQDRYIEPLRDRVRQKACADQPLDCHIIRLT